MKNFWSVVRQDPAAFVVGGLMLAVTAMIYLSTASYYIDVVNGSWRTTVVRTQNYNESDTEETTVICPYASPSRHISSKAEEPQYTREKWEMISQDPICQGDAPFGGGRQN